MRHLLPLLLFVPVAAGARTIVPGPDSALHGYVLGRYASATNQLAEAARLFDAARAQSPGSATLTRRAFDLALASGDRQRSFALARQLRGSEADTPEVAVVALADAVLQKDWLAADSARAGLARAGYGTVLAPIAEAWTLFGKGRTATALARLDPALHSGFTRSYVAEQRAHMLAATGQWRAAASAYHEQRLTAGPGISFLKLGEADALAMAGDRDAALALLADDEPGLAEARARLAAGKRIGALATTPEAGLAWAAARLANDLAREQATPLALLFARTATFLAPGVPANWIICGDILARGGQPDDALAAYARVPAGDALAPLAAARRTDTLEAAGRDKEAGALLRTAAEAPDAAPLAWQRLGDWHRRGDRFGEAIAAYGEAIRRAGSDAGWELYFLRGSAAEQKGDWPAAEADLRAALQRAPDEPVALNYLGYAMLDRGQGVAEASAMIARAAKQRPADGGIIDSLGWSQYRAGAYDRAVASLETAVALEPLDPTITDHLGDAYWRSGRRIEARFRWRAALDLDPDAKLKPVLQAKLDYGLDAARAMVK
ncbi:MAG: hypothetical protein CFE37_09325 [Alphaproteobacteria bacterium PA4]|nr:MAG: hypothetical protein CFE37_09325 [Alphaproteobacteria bacterium PA4]